MKIFRGFGSFLGNCVSFYVHYYPNFLDIKKPAVFGFFVAFVPLSKLPKGLNAGFFNLKN